MNNRFGTTSDMVIQTVEEKGQTLHLAIDTKGLYLTTGNWLDTSLADPNRYAQNREDMNVRIQALGMVPADMVAANQHLIKTNTATAKKVNPLKASKRKMGG